MNSLKGFYQVKRKNNEIINLFGFFFYIINNLNIYNI